MANAEKPARLSPRAAVQLAGIHTYPAAVLPVFIGAGAAFALGHGISPPALLLTLVTAVCLQSAVNTLNDRRDFVSGLDTAENCADPTDAAFIYEEASSEGALRLSLGFLLCAAVCGGLLVWKCGAELLFYGAAGLLAITLYVLPKLSFSELPLGEALSGLAMGGVLTCASFRVQTGTLTVTAALLSLPAVISIVCIMLANNASDIEKDAHAGRRTLAVLLGRRRAQALLRGLLVLSAAGALGLAAGLFPKSAAIAALIVPAVLLDRDIRSLFSACLAPARRGKTMAGVLSFNKKCLGIYALALFLAGAAA